MVVLKPLHSRSSRRSASNLNFDLPPEVKRYIPHLGWIEKRLPSHIHLFQMNPAISKVLTHAMRENKIHTISGRFEYLFTLIGDPG